MGKQDHRGHMRLLLLAIAVGSYFAMPTFNQNDLMEKYLARIITGFEGVLPVCLLVYIWGYERFQRRKNV
jgi:hypothetical protein